MTYPPRQDGSAEHHENRCHDRLTAHPWSGWAVRTPCLDTIDNVKPNHSRMAAIPRMGQPVATLPRGVRISLLFGEDEAQQAGKSLVEFAAA